MPRRSFGQKAAEIEANRLTVSFGPEVTEAFKKLDEVVCDDPRFDSDVNALLKSLAAGEEIDLQSAITRVAMVVQDATQFANDTGNFEARSAVSEVVGHLMGQALKAKPLTLMVQPKSPSRT